MMKTLMAVLMAVFAMACGARTIAEGLSVPQTRKNQLTLTQTKRKPTRQQLAKMKQDKKKQQEAGAAWLNAQQYRIRPTYVVPSRMPYSKAGFSMGEKL